MWYAKYASHVNIRDNASMHDILLDLRSDNVGRTVEMMYLIKSQTV